METLGLVETRTIAQGVGLMDQMAKAADLSLIQGRPICSGRFMIRAAGAQASVEEAMARAVGADPGPVETRVVPRVSPEVIQALGRRQALAPGMALGLVESRRAVSGIAAADAAVKRARVVLAQLAVAQGINGKSYLVLGGTVASVREAVAAACGCLGRQLLDHVVLPAPDPATVRALCPHYQISGDSHEEKTDQRP